MKSFTYTHKILSITFIFLFLCAPFISYAETAQEKKAREEAQKTAEDRLKSKIGTETYQTFNGSTGVNATVDTTGAPRAVIVDENGGTYLPATIQKSQSFGQTTNADQYGINPNDVSAGFSQCILGSALTGFVKNAISNVVGSAVDLVRVPVNNPVQEGKETGSVVTAGMSWDQTGWCMVNGLVHALGQSTVNWINTGFKGNPAFVEDPEQFFADIADVQAGVFLNEIADVNGALCTPLKDLVRINLANNYNNSINYRQQNQCSFSAISGNLEQFMSGETFSWTDWMSYTQNPHNNEFGATIYGQIQLDQRIAAKLGTQSTLLNWGTGFLSKKDANGKITSPGSVIEAQVNERLFSGQRRLEIADEFDEVVNALIGQVIQIAVSEMVSATSGN